MLLNWEFKSHPMLAVENPVDPMGDPITPLFSASSLWAPSVGKPPDWKPLKISISCMLTLPLRLDGVFWPERSSGGLVLVLEAGG